MNKFQVAFAHQQYLQHQYQHYNFIKENYVMTNSQFSHLSSYQAPFPSSSSSSFINRRYRKHSEVQIDSPTQSETYSYTQQQNKCSDIYYPSYQQQFTSNQQSKQSFHNIKENVSTLSTSPSSTSSSQSSSSPSSSLSSTHYNSSSKKQTERINNSKQQEYNYCKKKISAGYNAYTHQQQLQQSAQSIPSTLTTTTSQNVSENKFKTEMCKNWVEFGKCNYGKKCQFAHGKNELLEKAIVNKKQYKSKLCHSFHTLNFCSYGVRCMFIHESRSVFEIKQSYYYQKYLHNTHDLNLGVLSQQQAIDSLCLPQINSTTSSSSSSLSSSSTSNPFSNERRLSVFCKFASENKDQHISSTSQYSSIPNQQPQNDKEQLIDKLNPQSIQLNLPFFNIQQNQFADHLNKLSLQQQTSSQMM